MLGAGNGAVLWQWWTMCLVIGDVMKNKKKVT
jgi:hypothetical protein